MTRLFYVHAFKMSKLQHISKNKIKFWLTDVKINFLEKKPEIF